ncbi:MAG: alanine--tRNA ligase, partial [Muribaculaceae bacterium]
PQVIEIWNLVFMQYNRKADGSLQPLPARVIDTGMGFERLCMALQGKTSNYDTDVFQPLIKEIGKMAEKHYGDNTQVDIAMRVISDHVRTISFSIADSQLPSNAKAGYVIRRILRRAVRYGYTFLGQKKAFLYKLVDVLIESMGDSYPELKAQSDLIKKVIKEEEESFLRTLETGIKLIDKVIADTKATGKNEISGKEAFTLYDTYGFPLDLTELILKENEMTVNIEEFNEQMNMQKQRARNAAAVETGDWVVIKDGESKFVGYDLTEIDTEILRYRKVKQKNTEFYQIVLAQTPFYAEMGGQIGDNGKLINGDEVIEIFDTKRENNLAIHLSKKLPADITETFRAVINIENREAIACNHTATHLLHEALREVLGTHVEQKGSFVSADILRFDFSHFQKVTDEEIQKVEHLANAKVRKAIECCENRNVPIKEAREMGAMALFGEKYGDEVRVIKYGSSVELCGGTHVKNTGNIGMIKVVSESSIAAGIRRIEAITGSRVEDAVLEFQNTLKEISSMFNNTPNVLSSLQKSIIENADLRKQAEEFLKERIKALTAKLVDRSQNINGVNVIACKGARLAE